MGEKQFTVREGISFILLGIIGNFLIVLSAFYFNSEPGKTDCMREYVKSGEWVSYSYQLESGNLHVEKASSHLNDGLEGYRLGKNYGCAFTTLPTVAENVLNSTYCVTTYAYVNLGL